MGNSPLETALAHLLWAVERAVKKGYAPEEIEDAWDAYESAIRIESNVER